jgi:hypothetical protein
MRPAPSQEIPQPEKSNDPRRTRSVPARDTRDAGVSQHKPAKKSRMRIPPPQRERILQKHISGKSIVEISREEKRNRETIAKIVRSDEMREYVLRMRESFYRLADSALTTVRHAVEQEKDGQLSYKLLVDTGIVPTPVERMQCMAARESQNETDAVLTIAAKLFAGGISKLRAYGMDTTRDEDKLAQAGGRVDDNGNIVPLENSNASAQPAIGSDRDAKKQRSEKVPVIKS